MAWRRDAPPSDLEVRIGVLVCVGVSVSRVSFIPVELFA